MYADPLPTRAESFLFRPLYKLLAASKPTSSFWSRGQRYESRFLPRAFIKIAI